MANTVLQRTPRDQLPPEAGAAWDMLNGLTGEPAFIETMAGAPELLDLVMNHFYGRIFFGGRVEERYKQLLRLRLSLAHGCRSCNLQNVVGTRAVGFSDEAIASIEGDRASFSDAERAVLDFTDQMVMTNSAGQLSADLHARLSRHFDAAQICELAVVAGFIGGMAKMAFVLDLVEKEAVCPLSPA